MTTNPDPCPTWCSERDTGHEERDELHVGKERLITLKLEEPWSGKHPFHGQRVWQPRTAEINICQRIDKTGPFIELSIDNTDGGSSNYTLDIDEAQELSELLHDAFIDACEGSMAALGAREEAAKTA